MWRFDLFEFYRFMLTVLVCSYGVMQVVVFIWRFQNVLGVETREMSMLRRYLLVHVLRTRIRRFTYDFIEIVVLAGVLLLLVSRHWQ